jgi:acetolactate synthase regulatory subunit
MYVRIARFEGLDPARIDEQVAERREQMRASHASGELPEGAPEQVRTLMETVTRVIEAVDRERGIGVVTMFCATEEDAQRAHAALNEMSPTGGEGVRTSAEVLEVVLDEDFG